MKDLYVIVTIRGMVDLLGVVFFYYFSSFRHMCKYTCVYNFYLGTVRYYDIRIFLRLLFTFLVGAQMIYHTLQKFLSNPVPIETFAKYGRIDHLWVMPTTKISKSLKKCIINIHVKICFLSGL